MTATPGRVPVATAMLHGLTSFVIVILLGLHAPSAQALDKVRLQLKWLHQFQFAGYYAAQAKGYYRDSGLEVAIIPARPGDNAVQKVLAGEAEFGVGTTDLLLHRQKGDPVVALAAIFQHSPLALLARKTSGIQSLHDLASKKLMIEPGSAELFAYLRREGMAIDQVNLLAYDSALEKLVRGEIDGTSIYVTTESFTLLEGRHEYVLYSPRSAGIDFYGDNLFTTEGQIGNHPERVKAFRAASLKGWEYAMRHPEEIVGLIENEYKTARSHEHLLYEARQMNALLRPDLVEPGHMHPGRWQHIAEVYAELGMLPAKPNLEGFLYDPHPQPPDLTWLYLTLAGVVLLALAIASVAVYILRINRHLTSSEKRFRTVFDAVPVALIVTDGDDRIIDWNNGSRAMFGWTSAEAIGRSLYDLVVPPSAQAHTRDVVKGPLGDPHPTHSISQNLTKAGQLVTCDWSTAPFHDKNDRIVGVISLGIDITDRERAQARLREAKELAEHSLAEQRQFLAMVSHEFRSPLAVIDSSVQVLASRCAESGAAERIIQRVRRGIKRMTTFLENYLANDRFDSSGWEVQPESIAIHPFLAALAEQTQSLAGALHRVRVEADDLPRRCHGDPRLLTILVQNLLDNAVKYSPEGGEIVLRGTIEDDGALAISVSDQGIGIRPQEQDRIFSRYYRSSNVEHISGAGLGLTLVRRIVDLHGGTLDLASMPGKGSTFTVRLPQPRPGDGRGAEPAAGTRGEPA
ncbi:MAG: ABC transporter substrate-binding protein [Betaproteobacteria bacterium]|nr:ABC transporter substrate-binding protein [Betaproteobacteria bacterium]